MAPIAQYLFTLKSQYRLCEVVAPSLIAEAARLLAMNLAHYQAKYGHLSFDDTGTLMEADTIDDDTALLLVNGMENLVGVLGMLLQQEEDATAAH